MNSFDLSIIHFLNAFSHHSVLFDTLVVNLAENGLLKGGVIMALFWWAWESRGDSQPERREFLLFGLFASFIAIFLARFLALTLPFRARPMQNPLLGLQLPYDMKPDTLLQWSSFPSDNATLFFGLATALWMVSKRLGLFAYCYVLLMIALPRIYLGIHYPTDIIVGALLGVGAVSLANVTWLRKSATRPVLNWMNRFPAGGCVFLFLFSFEVAEEFNSLRQVALLGYHNITFALHAFR